MEDKASCELSSAKTGSSWEDLLLSSTGDVGESGLFIGKSREESERDKRA
jgi:hypothetical protein